MDEDVRSLVKRPSVRDKKVDQFAENPESFPIKKLHVSSANLQRVNGRFVQFFYILYFISSCSVFLSDKGRPFQIPNADRAEVLS